MGGVSADYPCVAVLGDLLVGCELSSRKSHDEEAAWC